MPLFEERRTALLKTTHEAACAFIEDMAYIHKIVAQKHTMRDEIRRLSGVLRRLLVEGDLRLIATPRIGRLLLRAPDNQSIYRSTRTTTNSLVFFASGRASVFGWVGNASLFSIRLDSLAPKHQTLTPEGFTVQGTVDLHFDNFLSQPVLYFFGTWIRRRAVLKYVANVASGVHSEQATTAEELIIAKIRDSVRYKISAEGKLNINTFPRGFGKEVTTFSYDPKSLDPVLVEVLATARFLTLSPDVAKLEQIIRSGIA